MNKLFRALLLCSLAFGISSPVRSYAQDREDGSQHAVFVMTNDAKHNEVLSFLRAPNGQLLEGCHFATGGRGSGGAIDPLGSQGSLLLSQDGQHLFAVNAGSGDVSVFRILNSELLLTDREPSGGSEPVAIAQHGNLLYALNAAGGSNVSGFHLNQGNLVPIANSTRFLTNNEPGGASISFSPDGRFLAVTEKQTNNIDVFTVQANGTLAPIKVCLECRLRHHLGLCHRCKRSAHSFVRNRSRCKPQRSHESRYHRQLRQQVSLFSELRKRNHRHLCHPKGWTTRQHRPRRRRLARRRIQRHRR